MASKLGRSTVVGESLSLQSLVEAPQRGNSQFSRIAFFEDPLPAWRFEDAFKALGWLFKVAGQMIFLSPLPIAGELWRLITNIGAQREIIRILKLPSFAEIVPVYPRLAFKCVIPNYLARSFTQTDRISCFLHHYKRLHSALPEHVLRKILKRDVVFYESSDGVNHIALTLGLSRPYFDQEGELSLNLQVNEKNIFSLSFTIVPGAVTKSKASETLLITRLQGTPGCNSEVKLARKALFDYSPRGPLLAALQGFAEVIGIDVIEAASARNLRSYRNDFSTSLKRGYDDFFSRVGMVRTSADFYSICLPIEGKPLAAFRGSGRPRARKRRAVRQQIKLACANFLLGETDLFAGASLDSTGKAPIPATVDMQVVTAVCLTKDNVRELSYSESQAEANQLDQVKPAEHIAR